MGSPICHCNNTTNVEDKYKTILLAMGGGGFVAFSVCLIAVILVIVLKLYKYKVHRLAMYQVLAALFYGITCSFELAIIKSNNIKETWVNEMTVCKAAGFLLEYGLWVKLMFTLGLTFYLFCYSVLHKDFKKFEVIHILISIFFPLLFTWIPFVRDTYGLAGAWCWIKNWNNNNPSNHSSIGEIEQIVLLYGPAMVCLSVAAIVVIVIIVVLLRRAYGYSNYTPNDEQTTPLLSQNREAYKRVFKQVLPLIAYPILSVALYIPAFINRLIGTLCNCVSFYSFMWSAISLPALSLFAGLTLIIHIVVLKCVNNRQTNTVYHSPTLFTPTQLTLNE